VASIDTPLILKVIEPLWRDKQETAARVRARIERVLSWATVRGYRQGDNPARWRGHLDQLFPRQNKREERHQAAMPYRDVPGFIHGLKLQFLILTAARTSEVLGAKWDEIDPDAKLWTVPGERMKAGREHRVPLSERAVAILTSMPRKGARVFEGISDATTMLRLLQRMDHTVTVHGFRSSFRDWAAEQTSFPREVIEMALAHQTISKVEAAYLRSDLFEKRRRLMAAWADFCTKPAATGATVTALRQR
jgi:integrase